MNASLISFLDTRVDNRSASPRLDSLTPTPHPVCQMDLFRRNPQQVLVFCSSGDLLTHGTLAPFCLREPCLHHWSCGNLPPYVFTVAWSWCSGFRGVGNEGGVADFFLNNQPDVLIIPILFCYKTLHVSDRVRMFHPDSACGHQKPAWNLPVPNVQ